MNLFERVPEYVVDEYGHWAERPIEELECLEADDEDTTLLDLRGVHIPDIGLISRALRKNTHLRSLQIDIFGVNCESILSLVTSIRQVQSLRTLRLYSNWINTDMHRRTSPHCGANLYLLLKRINPNVRTLQLGRVTSSATRAFRKSLASIQTLHLYDCFDGPKTSIKLIRNIGQALSDSRLTTLALKKMDSVRIIAPLVLAMTNHPHLTTLSLDHLTKWLGMAIRDVLDSDTKLRRLELVDSTLTVGNFSFVIQGLVSNRTVEAFIIRRCGIEDTSLLPTLLRSNNTTLTHFELTEPINCCCEAYDAVLEALVRNRVVKTLIMEGFVADKALTNFVARNRSVTHFSIGDSIAPFNFWKVQAGLQLRNNTTLVNLNLSCCGLVDQHVAVLAGSFVHSAIEVLLNHITRVTPLATCMTLKEIDLTWNDIDDEGAVHLSAMTQLETLNVNACLVGVRGFRISLWPHFIRFLANFWSYHRKLQTRTVN